jgi:hypothetical protein
MTELWLSEFKTADQWLLYDIKNLIIITCIVHLKWATSYKQYTSRMHETQLLKSLLVRNKYKQKNQRDWKKSV